jgi:uncharacterized protein YcaQ
MQPTARSQRSQAGQTTSAAHVPVDPVQRCADGARVRVVARRAGRRQRAVGGATRADGPVRGAFVAAFVRALHEAVTAPAARAVGSTRVAFGRVAVVAFLVAGTDAVAARARRTVRVAAVAVHEVAVVAGLAGIEMAVAAERIHFHVADPVVAIASEDCRRGDGRDVKLVSASARLRADGGGRDTISLRLAPCHALPSMPLPLRAVSALFLERQQLDRPRARRLTRTSLERLAAATGGIQLDSINVVERAHLLTLWSRFGSFDRGLLERLVYRDRVLFEYWAHAACLIAAGDLPAWRRAMLDYSTEHRGWSGWLQTNRPLVRMVEAEIAARGPLSSSDFSDPRTARGLSGWWNWKPAAHALDYLWMTGRVLVHSRVGFQKRYDLAERVLPASAAVAPLSAAEFRRWHLAKALHAMGAATETDLRLYLTYPRFRAPERRRVLERALATRAVVEIAIEGDRGRWFALAADVPALDRAAARRVSSRGATFLAPFDSLLWHRERTRRLFGFDYRLEVYTPPAKRRFGYYTLPVLVDGRLVGRVDAKAHRSERRLALRHVAFEAGIADAERAIAGTAEAARALAVFVAGTDAVSVERITPAAMRPAFRRALAG